MTSPPIFHFYLWFPVRKFALILGFVTESNKTGTRQCDEGTKGLSVLFLGLSPCHIVTRVRLDELDLCDVTLDLGMCRFIGSCDFTLNSTSLKTVT